MTTLPCTWSLARPLVWDVPDALANQLAHWLRVAAVFRTENRRYQIATKGSPEIPQLHAIWMAMGGLWKLSVRCANSKFFASSIDFFDFQGLPFAPGFFAARFGALGAPVHEGQRGLDHPLHGL
jgi:hypothetical protein